MSAFTGVMIGRRYLAKATMGSVQTLVGILLFGVGTAPIIGLL